MDYFVWVAKGKERAVIIDIGFTEEVAAKRGRTFLRCPIEAMGLIGVEAAAVKDVVLTHLHYDHCGNLGRFPAARFHLQESEIHYATGRYMAYPKLSHSFEVEDVCDVVRLNYGRRIKFYNGDAELAPGIELYAARGHCCCRCSAITRCQSFFATRVRWVPTNHTLITIGGA
jgi:glyoxylase-like metal-dependent hydrolase (beta-lactamase superfamily II)